jgi:hypothetical protein
MGTRFSSVLGHELIEQLILTAFESIDLGLHLGSMAVHGVDVALRFMMLAIGQGRL